MKDIPGYEGFYVASEDGTIYGVERVINNGTGVRKINIRVIKGGIYIGYRRMCLTKNRGKRNFFAHRLIALTFIPNPENKPQVNHKDGDKLNNSVSNLEWCTGSENEKHSYDVLGKKMKFNQARRDALVKYNTGRIVSEATRLKIAKSMMGKKNRIKNRV